MREFTTKDLGWITVKLGAIAHRNKTAKRTIELMQEAKDDMARLQVIYDLIQEIYDYKEFVERRINFFDDIERRYKKDKRKKKMGRKNVFSTSQSKPFVIAPASDNKLSV